MLWNHEYLLLTWAALSISLANVILLGWLGLTVLLNAEHRDAGVVLAGAGLLLGAAFFVSHTALLGLSIQELAQASWRLNLWWRAGWLPLAAAPFAWYLMVLWYTGYWENEPFSIPLQPTLRFRHRLGIGATGVLLLLLMALLLATGSLPTFVELAQRQIAMAWNVASAPLLLIIFPLYILLCIGLALDALYHPLPSSRLMGDQARARARPWLIGATLMLLVVSMLVVGVIFWLLYVTEDTVYERVIPLTLPLARVDLLITALIGLAIYLVGQGIIAYEIFTGGALPRQALRRNWLNAVGLALCFGGLASAHFAFQLEPVSTLLLAAVLMTGFYALVNRSAYRHREEEMRQLRPFVGSQHLYEQLLGATPSPGRSSFLQPASSVPPNGQGPFPTHEPESDHVDAYALFYNLCHDVLQVEQAHLVPLGALAPMLGGIISYPQARHDAQSGLTEIVEQQTAVLASSGWRAQNSPAGMALDPARSDGLKWSVPLWSERGLIGFFLLGSKRNSNLLTQEEIELARASGERLIDTQAGLEIGRRLLALQRRQLAESQLLDRRARRILHDEVLPQLHTALLALTSLPRMPEGQPSDEVAPVADLLTDTHQQIAALLRTMPARAMPQLSELGLVGALQALAADELANAFDAVRWQVDEDAVQAAATLSPLTQEVLFYAAREAMRNAARHGRSDHPQRALELDVAVLRQNGLHIQVQDNGVGLATHSHDGADHAVREATKGGHGLTLHSTLLAIVGGELTVQSQPQRGVCVTIWLPLGFM
ncbi:MAG: ATP-binding protein [Caldilineaceae bacterium]|nr:ATP-binding protein [Caldilineaceae bacterium]